MYGNLLLPSEKIGFSSVWVDGGKVVGDIHADEVLLQNGAVVFGNINCKNMIVKGDNITMKGQVHINSDDHTNTLEKVFMKSLLHLNSNL